MKRRPDLADRVALALIEHGPMPCEPLARRVAARKADVLAALRADRRFKHSGFGRGSRWRLVLPPASAWEQVGTIPSAGSRSEHGADVAERLAALERRVAELEQLLAELGAPR